MRILRTGEVREKGMYMCCTIYVRKDFAVVNASEWYYRYVGSNSYLPITDLIDPEDAAILEEAIEKVEEPVEVFTRITNHKDGYRNVYLRLEKSDLTEDGQPLYEVTILDILDLEGRNGQLETNVAKYRYFMTLETSYYFDYSLKDNKIVIYKYVNEKSIKLVDMDLDSFVEEYTKGEGHSEKLVDQMNAFSSHLKGGSRFFEMDFTGEEGGKYGRCGVKGGVYYKNKGMVTGIFTPDRTNVKEAYYLTEAAKDAGTGLLNKKAATEYAIEKLAEAGDKTMWVIVMDIDDFKNVNDTFGHLFGDQVIRKVAETLQGTIGQRGIVGRFGGDEFFVLLEKVGTREDLKTLLKTITKQLAVAFDPKFKLTTSIGVCQYPVEGTNFGELFGKADKALYIAKEKGKNRHIIYEEKVHGTFTADSMKSQSVAYAVSREKRREMLIDLMSNLYLQGVEYVTERPEVQKTIRDLFDLDGFTICSEYGRKIVCCSGNYMRDHGDMHLAFEDEAFVKLFGEQGIFVVTTLEKLKAANENAFEVATELEIGAMIQCMVRKEGRPYAIVNFDVFNRNRKWSNNDIELLGMIGTCIGRILAS